MDSRHRIRTLRAVARHWLSGGSGCLSVPPDRHLAPLARRHGMSPILARLVQEGRLDFGCRHMKETLSFQAGNRAVRSRYLMGELSWVAGAFANEGLPLITFKGPTLSYLAYGDPGLGATGTLDILIAPGDVDAAGALLKGRGYRPLETGSHRALRSRWSHRATYEGPGPGNVELHWSLLPGALGSRWPGRGPQPRAVLLDLGGVTVPTLAPEDLALFLAIHGARHGWAQLEWLLAFAALGTRLDTWPRVLGQATSTGNLRCLLLAWTLATELLDARAPRAIQQRLPGEAAVGRLARRLSAGLHRSAPGALLRSPGATMLWPLQHAIRPLGLGLAAASGVLRTGKRTSQRRKPGVRLFFRPPVRVIPSRPGQWAFRRASSSYPT